MLKTILPKQMKELETDIIMTGAVSGERLMDRAADALCAEVSLHLPKGSLAVFACGCGNNGGDGLCAARKLLSLREDVRVICVLLKGKHSADWEREMRHLLRDCAENKRLTVIDNCPDEAFSIDVPPAVVVDAMYGTGLDRPLQGSALQLCELINKWHEQGAYCIACDIPSGLNGTDGRILENAVCADETVTFHRPKTGLYLREGPNVSGNVKTASIGLETYLQDASVDGMDLLSKHDAKAMLPRRKAVSHKGDYGRVLLLCGSVGMAGAAALCANAALRTGTGLCTLAACSEIVPIVQTLAPCATCLPLENDEDSLDRLLKKAESSDAIAIGCGLGQSDFAARTMESLLACCVQKKIPCVIDADGLNLLAGHLRERDFMGENLYLTPHMGEAARLLNSTVLQVMNEPLAVLSELVERYGAHVMLKGARSLMKSPAGKMAVNVYGTPALSKGGSGDTLTGILAALLAGVRAGCYTMNGLEAMQLACLLHTSAAEKAQSVFGERGLLATDVIQYLGCDDLFEE